MSVAPIDLSALDAFETFGPARTEGKPLLLDIDLLHEDPNQPRKSFDDMADITAAVAEVGVKVPLSVRPHPDMPGHYMVKFGARRRRAAIAVGLKQVPVWIDVVPSDFEQVVENLHRADLTPMEMAQFIAEKQSSGMRQAVIAKKLGINRSAVTKYLALINLPPEVETVYRSGRNTSPDTLFDLRALYTRFPEETSTWLAQDVEVSRRSVEALRQRLTHENGTLPSGEEKRAKARKATPAADPAEIKRPVVSIKVGERTGIVVLSRRAAHEDHVLVKWNDTAEIAEVPSQDIRLLRVDDARRYEPINRGLTAVGETPTSLTGEPDAAV